MEIKEVIQKTKSKVDTVKQPDWKEVMSLL